MRKIYFAVAMAALLSGCLQQQSSKDQQTPQEENLPAQTSETVRYKLYPTKNLWTFLKLDTQTGRIWHLQYTIDDKKERLEYDLNPKTLLPANAPQMNGRFELYPTQNMFNFILVDQIDGATWQVQWSFEEDKRMVVPISR